MLDAKGHEIMDPTPVSLPAGFKRPETLAEQVQRLVRNQVSQEAHKAGAETFEEAEDFDIEDEIDPSTPYEAEFDPTLGREVTAQEFHNHETKYRQRYLDEQHELHRQYELEAAIRKSTYAKPLKPEAPSPKPAENSENGPLRSGK